MKRPQPGSRRATIGRTGLMGSFCNTRATHGAFVCPDAGSRWRLARESRGSCHGHARPTGVKRGAKGGRYVLEHIQERDTVGAARPLASHWARRRRQRTCRGHCTS
jgi:hypothetical protein